MLLVERIHPVSRAGISRPGATPSADQLDSVMLLGVEVGVGVGRLLVRH